MRHLWGLGLQQCIRLTVALALVALAAAAPAAEPGTPPARRGGSANPAPNAAPDDPAVKQAERTLAAKGLVRFASSYLLPEDAKLYESLRQIQKSEGQLRAFMSKRRDSD